MKSHLARHVFSRFLALLTGMMVMTSLPLVFLAFL
jgi:hypothetical protein